jgi:putative oxidoreductase
VARVAGLLATAAVGTVAGGTLDLGGFRMALTGAAALLALAGAVGLAAIRNPRSTFTPGDKRSERLAMHRPHRTNPTTLPSAGVLLLRGVVGMTFLLHGLDKLGDLAGAEQLFTSLDIPAPDLMAPFVAVTETVGGVLLIAGLATPLVGAALAVDMLVALLTAHLGHGFFARDGGFELELLLGGASAAIGIAGAGRFSLDASLELSQRFLRRASGLSG